MSEHAPNKQPNVTSTRRERVAQLVLRGLTAREIVAALASGDNRIINGRTGEPWSLGTIGSDLKALKTEWNRRAAEAYDEHRARQLAEVAELKRAAWAARRYDTVLRAMEREAKLLGLDAPISGRVEVTGKDGGKIEIKHDFNDDQLSEIGAILAAAGAFAATAANALDAEDDALHPTPAIA